MAATSDHLGWANGSLAGWSGESVRSKTLTATGLSDGAVWQGSIRKVGRVKNAHGSFSTVHRSVRYIVQLVADSHSDGGLS